MYVSFFPNNSTAPEAPTLHQASRILSEFQAYNRSMTIETANVFLMVAVNEGLRLTDYCAMTGLAKSTLSRILLDLSAYRRDQSEDAEEGRKEAYGLLVTKDDPNELRSKFYFLTPKGQAFRDRILGIMRGDKPKGPVKSPLAVSQP